MVVHPEVPCPIVSTKELIQHPQAVPSAKAQSGSCLQDTAPTHLLASLWYLHRQCGRQQQLSLELPKQWDL